MKERGGGFRMERTSGKSHRGTGQTRGAYCMIIVLHQIYRFRNLIG